MAAGTGMEDLAVTVSSVPSQTSTVVDMMATGRAVGMDGLADPTSSVTLADAALPVPPQTSAVVGMMATDTAVGMDGMGMDSWAGACCPCHHEQARWWV